MVLVLEKHLVEEMGRIGRERAPAEAAGVLLPFPFQGTQVIELPNRSMTPHDHFLMQGEDLALALEPFAEAHPDKELWMQVALWHTHPGGNLGPSKYDLKNRCEGLRHLVISLHENDEVKATWY